MYDVSFYKNKRVFVTGHTGFKGSWLTKILLMAGAKVCGYSLAPKTQPNLFNLLNLEKEKNLESHIGDIRNKELFIKTLQDFKPEIVFHLAAQPIVRESYKNPVLTYETNVLGTVYICEAVRLTTSVKSFVNVTTDKVYENNDLAAHKFKEDEKLDGYDPYSNSKSCSELVTHSYKKSFLNELNIPTSTARAGNVIGGGDFSIDRIIPDCARAVKTNSTLIIRNPNSTRPYQHVFDALGCYFLIGEKQYNNLSVSDSFNIGPNEADIITNIKLVDTFNSYLLTHFKYEIKSDNGPHEASFLSLDNGLIKNKLGWKPQFEIESALQLTAEWYQAYVDNKSLVDVSEEQIKRYFKL